MKFYFDGDSFTFGGGLDKIFNADPTKYRWSKLVCDHFGAEEINISKSGASNERILRQFFAEDRNFEQYDCIFIQLTCSFRYEWWSNERNKWINSGLPLQQTLRYPGDRFLKFRKELLEKERRRYGEGYNEWETYRATHILSDKDAMTKELVAYNSIKSHLELIGKPFFLSALTNYNHIKYDYDFNKENFDRIVNDGHPSILGHKQIAKKVIHKVKDKL